MITLDPYDAARVPLCPVPSPPARPPNPRALRQLRNACERAKRMLSAAVSAEAQGRRRREGGLMW